MLLVFCSLISLFLVPSAFASPRHAAELAQTAVVPKAVLRELRAEGMKSLTESQVAALTGLQTGAQVSREDLQSAADKLMHSGLFSHVKYSFQTRPEGLFLTFRVEEAPRIPAYFDNFPWFADSELKNAIRDKLPLFDGTLPGDGTVVDQANDAVSQLVAAHDIHVTVTHQIIAAPASDGTVQEFHAEGAALRIARVEFSDPALNSSRLVQQHLDEIVGKPYSRALIDLFLSEQIRPIYLQQGYLRATLGPPAIRLTGNPSQKLPDELPVYVPVSPGAVYHWKNVEWDGNTVVPSDALTTLVIHKPGDVADGMATEAAWEQVREEYARRGYLEAKVDPSPTYDDAAHTISYRVSITEGSQYRFGSMTITGLSPTAEKRLRDEWPIPQGALFDKSKFEQFLTALQTHPPQIFGELPLHYDTVGHWLQPDPGRNTVDVLLDFK